MDIEAPKLEKREQSSARARQLTQRSRVGEGLPFPLGSTWDGLGVNFAIFSAHATKVELCLFDIDGRREIERIELPEYTDEIWHVSARRAAWNRLCVPGPWTLRAQRRPPVQSAQAPARPLCQAARRRARLARRALRLHHRRQGQGPLVR